MHAAGITEIGGPVRMLNLNEPHDVTAEDVVIDARAAGVDNCDELVRVGSWQIEGPPTSPRPCSDRPRGRGLTARRWSPGHLLDGAVQMSARSLTVVGVLLVITTFCRHLEAQELAPRHEATLDASVLAGGLSYAWRSSSDRLVGVGMGVGAELNIRLVHGEPWGKKSMEIAHVEWFERLEPPGRWRYDLGVRAAIDLHSAQVSSEGTLGGFFGGYIAPMWGGHRFQIGPRLQAGTYWSSAHPAFGISVTPLTARVHFEF
jgi:hypothetical protein